MLKVIVANPIMIKAYKAGIPGNGQPFPDGSKIAKLQWKPKEEARGGPLSLVDCSRCPSSQAFVIEKNSKKISEQRRLGLRPLQLRSRIRQSSLPMPASLSDCGHTCHVAVKAKDYIFHPYQKHLHIPRVTHVLRFAARTIESHEADARGHGNISAEMARSISAEMNVMDRVVAAKTESVIP